MKEGRKEEDEEGGEVKENDGRNEEKKMFGVGGVLLGWHEK